MADPRRCILMGMIKRFVLALFTSMAVFTPLMGAVARADCHEASGAGVFDLIPTWHKYLDHGPNCEISDFAFPSDVWKVGLAIVEIVLRIAGMIAVGYVIWAGFKFVLSRGNPSEAAKARQTIIDAVIGAVIASLATVLVGFLGRALVQ